MLVWTSGVANETTETGVAEGIGVCVYRDCCSLTCDVSSHSQPDSMKETSERRSNRRPRSSRHSLTSSEGF